MMVSNFASCSVVLNAVDSGAVAVAVGTSVVRTVAVKAVQYDKQFCFRRCCCRCCRCCRRKCCHWDAVAVTYTCSLLL